MKKKILVLIFILMINFIIAACEVNTSSGVAVASSQEASVLSQGENFSSEKLNTSQISKELTVHFINVGQADCTLIELPNGEKALIDAGNIEDAHTIINYIKSLNIDTIEYMILTHPHEDHIGSVKNIIEEIEIEKIYVPDVTVDTKSYENTMNEINKINIPVVKAKGELNIIDTPEIKFEVLAPKSMYYSEMNEYSIVTKLDYEETSFIFTGDAESVSELEMIRDSI